MAPEFESPLPAGEGPGEGETVAKASRQAGPDFACLELQLVIEVDGSRHADANHGQADEDRDGRLAEAGYRVLRFWNHQLYEEPETVLDQIRVVCEARSSR